MKKIHIALTVFLLFLLISCSRSSNISTAQISAPKLTKYSEIYIAALESFIKTDEGLNSNMKYIAINTNCLRGATKEDKQAILNYFRKYGIEVIDESFESLKKKGMVKEGNSIEGILLTVEWITFNSETEAIIDGSKFRSGLGAIGVKSVVKLTNGKWKLYRSDINWIS